MKTDLSYKAQIEKTQSRTISFLLKDGKFIELFKAYSNSSFSNVTFIDNNLNMIVNMGGLGECFFSYSKSSLIRMIRTRNDKIINDKPNSVFCLPPELKIGTNGVAYFSPGIEIRKLITPISPFWMQDCKTIHIKDQNSKGYVVGSAETLYLNSLRHAFLAVPSNQ